MTWDTSPTMKTQFRIQNQMAMISETAPPNVKHKTLPARAVTKTIVWMNRILILTHKQPVDVRKTQPKRTHRYGNFSTWSVKFVATNSKRSLRRRIIIVTFTTRSVTLAVVGRSFFAVDVYWITFTVIWIRTHIAVISVTRNLPINSPWKTTSKIMNHLRRAHTNVAYARVALRKHQNWPNMSDWDTVQKKTKSFAVINATKSESNMSPRRVATNF